MSLSSTRPFNGTDEPSPDEVVGNLITGNPEEYPQEGTEFVEADSLPLWREAGNLGDQGNCWGVVQQWAEVAEVPVLDTETRNACYTFMPTQPTDQLVSLEDALAASNPSSADFSDEL
ncbi:hypothetical protein Agub_g7751, partial [Astrephomene gubernaculifera]